VVVVVVRPPRCTTVCRVETEVLRPGSLTLPASTALTSATTSTPPLEWRMRRRMVSENFMPSRLPSAHTTSRCLSVRPIDCALCGALRPEVVKCR
jgi:hypothetical protein